MLRLPLPANEVLYVTADQMAEVDRAMVDDLKIELIQMMENAGRNLAHLARLRFLDRDPRGKLVIILAGTGGNGGGALVCARWLHNWGAQVQVFVTRPDQDFSPVSGHQLGILRRMSVPIAQAVPLASVHSPALIIDGLIGYNLKNAPRGAVANMIGWANRQTAPILALDVPSGVDATTGAVFDPAIKATATMTLALPKTGLREARAEAQIGELYLADIGVPPSLYATPALALNVGPVFAIQDIIRLR